MSKVLSGHVRELLRGGRGSSSSLRQYRGRDPTAESAAIVNIAIWPHLLSSPARHFLSGLSELWTGQIWYSAHLCSNFSMPSTKPQRPRRQTAPSGPARKPTTQETRPSLEPTPEDPDNLPNGRVPEWNNELEFSDWFNCVKDDLIEESYDQYQYVQ